MHARAAMAVLGSRLKAELCFPVVSNRSLVVSRWSLVFPLILTSDLFRRV